MYPSTKIPTTYPQTPELFWLPNASIQGMAPSKGCSGPGFRKAQKEPCEVHAMPASMHGFAKRGSLETSWRGACLDCQGGAESLAGRPGFKRAVYMTQVAGGLIQRVLSKTPERGTTSFIASRLEQVWRR